MNILSFKFLFPLFCLFTTLINAQAPVNDECENPIQLTCSSVIIGNTSEATFANINNDCILENKADLWYSVTGNGMLLEFSYINGQDGDIRFDIYRETCSNAYTDCFTNFNIYNNLNNTNGFISEVGQQYLIRVSTGCCNVSQGEFSFSVNCIEAPTNDLCEDAIPLNCDLEISQSTVSLSLDNNYCLGSSSVTLHWYTLEGNDGYHIFEYLSAPTGSFNMSIFPDSCPDGSSTCAVEYFHFWSSDQIHEFFAEEGTTYIVRVETSDCCRGDLSFFHRCVVPPENNDCENPQMLNCGDIVMATTNGATTAETAHGCSNEDRDDIWFTIVGNNEIVDLSLIDEVDIFIEAQIFSASCDMEETNCLIEIYDLGVRSLRFYAQSGVEYTLRLSTSSYYILGQDFMFTMSCRPSQQNDFCENAQSISCGSSIVTNFEQASPSYIKSYCLPDDSPDLWYKITGDGRLLEFTYHQSLSSQDIRISFSDVSCGIEPEFCLNNINFRHYNLDTIQYFYAEDGVEYLFNISDHWPNSNSHFELSINCVDPLSNDLCVNPQSFQCGDTLIFDNSLATSATNFQNCNNTYGNELWYTISGDNQMHIFSKLNSAYNDDVRIIFKELSCAETDTICSEELTLHRFNNYRNSFFAEVGIDYVIAISSRYSFVDTIIHECDDIITNNICLNAIELMCGDSIFSNSLLATNSLPDIDCYQTESPDLWYKITGDNNFYNFSYLLSSNSDINFEYFIGCETFEGNNYCRNLVTDVTIHDSISQIFYLDTSEELYIRVTQCCREGEFGFTLECEDIEVAEECLNATTISCGTIIAEDGTAAQLPSFDNHCTDGNDESYWYNFMGTGQLFRMTNLGPDYLRIVIFEGECISSPFPANCIERFDFGPGELGDNIVLELNKSYWIQIINSEQEFEIAFECIDPLPNDNCNTAQLINCGDIIPINLNDATISENGPNCANVFTSDVWYSISGNDEFYEIELQNIDEFVQIYFQIIDGGCNSTQNYCPDEYLYNEGDSFRFFAEQDSSYLISIQISCCDQDLNFDLSISCADAPVNDNCENPISINCTQDIISGTTAYANEIDYSTSCNVSFNEDVWYTFVGDNNFYYFDYLSSVSSRIDIDIFSGSCDSLICERNMFVREYDNERSFFAVEGVTYLMSLSPCCSAGDFEISLRCISPIGNDLCEMALPLECGDIITANTTDRTPSLFLDECETNHDQYNDIWYSFTGDGMIRRFSNEGQSTILDIYTGTCDVEELICERTIRLTLSQYYESSYSVPGVEYYVRAVSCCTNTGGDLAFSVECFNPAENDLCLNPIMLSCGETIVGNTIYASERDVNLGCGNEYPPDLWYAIIGDGRSYNFEFVNSITGQIVISLNQQQCGPYSNCKTETIEINESFSFVAELGNTYYFRIFTGYNYMSPGEFSFKLSCQTPPVNNNCDSPTELFCGTTISNSTAFASASQFYNNCSYSNQNDVWYFFEGNDSLQLFNYISSTNSQEIKFHLYNTESCIDIIQDTTGMTCETRFELNPQNPRETVFTDASTTYLVQISLDNTDGNFSFGMTCAQTASNDTCKNPLQIECGDSIIGNPNLASITEESNGCYNAHNPNLWYTMIGDGNIYSISVIEDSARGRISVSTGDCSNLTCIENEQIQGTDPSGIINFITESGVTYYINAMIQNNDEVFTLHVDCAQVESNDLIENAIPIECGDEISTNTIFSTNTETLDLCGNPNSNDVWYIMNGTGEVNYFNLISGVLSNVYIEVYTQSSIGLDCIYNEIISDNVSAFFLAELDIQYYIRVYARDREAAFSLKTSCSESPNNISCETSINLSCNQIIEGTFFGATNSTVNCFPGQNQSGVWYTVIGDGNSYIINIESLDSNLNGTDNSTIYIIEEDCSMGSCSIYEPIINGELNEITFLEDIEYHIFVSNKNLFFDFVINIYCQPQNGTCENAILVSCDTPVTGYSWGLDYNVTSNCVIIGTAISWFTFFGTGTDVRILLNSNSDHLIEVYESSCDDFICLYENPTNPAFFAEEGKEYTIAILDVNELLIDEFELTISCNYFEVADPCVCNNDQFSSLENIGSFNETVTINNTTASEIWTVIAIDSENGDIKPSNIEIGDKLSFDQINFDHKIEFVHYDNFGYTITVEGPSELGHINNFATSLSNVCSYPEKFPITDELFVFIEDTIQAEEILTEINDHYGYAIESQNQVHLFPIPASEIGPGVHNVILQTSDSNGCLTEQELIIIVETEVSIPTLGEWGLVCLGLLFLIFGITCIREFGYENTVHTD